MDCHMPKIARSLQTALAVALALSCISDSARADWINLTGADTASTILEI